MRGTNRSMKTLRHTLGALALLVLFFMLAAAPSHAQEATTFPAATVTGNFYNETLRHNIPNLLVTRNDETHNVNFLDHYRATGGLIRWGHPTSEVIEEETGNLAQYYQRGVVDWHWRADLGGYVMERRLAWDFFGGGAGGSFDQGVEPGILNPHPGDEVGPWGHKVSDFSIEGIYTGFKGFYESLGGVQAFGYPKTDARIDTNADGTLHIQAATPGFIRQYFQSAVLEYHQGDDDPVKLRLLGDDLRNLNYPGDSWRSYAAFNDATALSEGQQYAVPRVVRGRTGTGQPAPAPRPTAAPRATPGVVPTAPPGVTPTPITAPPTIPTPSGVTSVWFATYGRGVSHFNGAEWTYERTFDSALPDDRVLDVYIDSAGAKWIATENGLARLHNGSWTVYNSNTRGFPPGNRITSVHSHGGLLLIGTDGSGAGVFSNNRWESFRTGNVSGIPSNNVRDVLVYSAEPRRAWLATANGVARYDDGQWQIYRQAQGLASNDTLSVAIDGNRVWVGTNGAGVSVYDGTTWTTYDTSNSKIAHDTVRSITVGPVGRVWLATDGGVSVYDNSSGTWKSYSTFNSSLVHNSVYDIAVDERGRVWIATNAGANLLEGGRWTSFQVANSHIGHDSLRAVAVE